MGWLILIGYIVGWLFATRAFVLHEKKKIQKQYYDTDSWDTEEFLMNLFMGGLLALLWPIMGFIMSTRWFFDPKTPLDRQREQEAHMKTLKQRERELELKIKEQERIVREFKV